jgi:hypothetical protein
MQISDNSFRVAMPFGTRRQALQFLAIILIALSLPVFNEHILSRRPADVYRTVPPEYLNYKFIGDEISQGGLADIVIIGSSDAWTSFDVKSISATLSKKLGRSVRVLNFGTNWSGAETNYQRVKDLLTNLKVKVLILTEGNWAPGDDYPHRLAKFLLAIPDVQTASLITPRQATMLYGSVVLGAPHRTWSVIRDVATRPMLPLWEAKAEQMRLSSGFLGERQGWKPNRSPDSVEPMPYLDLDLAVPTYPTEDFFYKGHPDDLFALQGPYDEYQTAFLKLIDQSVRRQGGVFAVVAPPIFFHDAAVEKVNLHSLARDESRSWPTVGISMTRLFPGRTFDDMKQFYSNESHLGDSGARLFGKAIVPALSALLAKASGD